MSQAKRRIHIAKEYNLNAQAFWVYLPKQVSEEKEFSLLPEKIEELGIYVIADENIAEYADAVVITLKNTDKDVVQKVVMHIGKYNLVPILFKNEKLSHIYKEFDPIAENGCAFYYQRKNPWHIYAAIVRASENFRFSYDWEQIIKRLKNA